MAIPASVRASKAVTHGERYEGDLGAAQLQRLASSEPRVHAQWSAGRDPAGHPQLQGRIEGLLKLVCQRCLSPFDWPFELEARLQLVASDAEAARVLHDSDPYQVEDDQLPLRDITEDEVLLAMPLMPRCKTCENAAHSQSPSRPDEPKGSSPFAVLKKLKF